MEKTEQFPNPFDLSYVSILVKNPKKLFVKGRYNKGDFTNLQHVRFFSLPAEPGSYSSRLSIGAKGDISCASPPKAATVFILPRRAASKARTCCPLGKVFRFAATATSRTLLHTLGSQSLSVFFGGAF